MVLKCEKKFNDTMEQENKKTGLNEEELAQVAGGNALGEEKPDTISLEQTDALLSKAD